MANVRRTQTSVKKAVSPPRKRRARGSLTAEAILNAAEEAATDGFDEITVRAVAARLDAAPMSLYRYFPTKSDLVDSLLDRVLGRFAPPSTTNDWATDLTAFARAHRQVLVDHPWAVTAFFAHANPGVNATRIGEVALEILERGGLRGAEAVAAFSGLLAINYGWCGFAFARSGPEEVAAMRAQLASLPADLFPRTAAVAVPMADYGSDEHYEMVLRCLIAGLGGRTKPPRSPHGRGPAQRRRRP